LDFLGQPVDAAPQVAHALFRDCHILTDLIDLDVEVGQVGAGHAIFVRGGAGLDALHAGQRLGLVFLNLSQLLPHIGDVLLYLGQLIRHHTAG
jgi:hypothetical protein